MSSSGCQLKRFKLVFPSKNSSRARNTMHNSINTISNNQIKHPSKTRGRVLEDSDSVRIKTEKELDSFSKAREIRVKEKREKIPKERNEKVMEAVVVDSSSPIGSRAPVKPSSKKRLQAERVKNMLRRKAEGRLNGKKFPKSVLKESLPKDEEYALALSMAAAYGRKLAEYKDSPYSKYLKDGKLYSDSRNYRSFVNASIIGRLVEMDPADYIESQFYWFHKWFRRPPKPYELCGMSSKHPAPERATKWKKLVEQGKITERGRAVSSSMEVHIPAHTYVKHGRRLLQDLMQVRKMTEEEVLLLFGDPSLGYFPVQYLKTNRTWKRLKSEGRV